MILLALSPIAYYDFPAFLVVTSYLAALTFVQALRIGTGSYGEAFWSSHDNKYTCCLEYVSTLFHSIPLGKVPQHRIGSATILVLPSFVYRHGARRFGCKK